eukprot:jgi/Psemu1/18014/gm1.18014_g
MPSNTRSMTQQQQQQQQQLSPTSPPPPQQQRPLPPWPVVSPAPHTRRECPGAPIQQKKSRSRMVLAETGCLLDCNDYYDYNDDDDYNDESNNRVPLQPRQLFRGDEYNTYDVDEYRALTSSRRRDLCNRNEQRGEARGQQQQQQQHGNPGTDHFMDRYTYSVDSPPVSPVRWDPGLPLASGTEREREQPAGPCSSSSSAAATTTATRMRRIISPSRGTSNGNSHGNSSGNNEGGRPSSASRSRSSSSLFGKEFEGRIRSASTYNTSNTSQRGDSHNRR